MGNNIIVEYIVPIEYIVSMRNNIVMEYITTMVVGAFIMRKTGTIHSYFVSKFSFCNGISGTHRRYRYKKHIDDNERRCNFSLFYNKFPSEQYTLLELPILIGTMFPIGMI